jgi:hypothetical protein
VIVSAVLMFIVGVLIITVLNGIGFPDAGVESWVYSIFELVGYLAALGGVLVGLFGLVLLARSLLTSTGDAS